MILRPFLNDETLVRQLPVRLHARTAQFAVVDPHVDLVDDYIALPPRSGAPIVAVLRDARAGRPRLRAARSSSSAPARRAYLPAGAGVEFDHHALADGEVVELGNTDRARDRHARPRAGAPRLPGLRPARAGRASRGWCSPATRC